MKFCVKCNKEKSLDNFWFLPSKNDYYIHCRECSNIIAKEWRNKNPRRIKISRLVD